MTLKSLLLAFVVIVFSQTQLGDWSRRKRSDMKVLFVEVSELVFFRTTTNITRHSLLKTGDIYGQTSGTELEACEMIICLQAISL